MPPRQARDEKILWHKIARLIAKRIETGKYPVSSILPREIDLAAEFGVSRNTVREALRSLTDQGLVARRRRAGTSVIRRSAESRFVLDLDPLASIRELHRKSVLRVLSRSRGALPLFLREGWPNLAAGDWNRVNCVRVTKHGGQLLSATQFYIAAEFAEVTQLIGASDKQVFRLIESLSREVMSQARTRLIPVKVNAELASLLKVPRNSLAMKVVHSMSNAKGTVREFVVSIYPIERYAFELTFTLRD